jgi:hypothetical protein
LRSTPLPVTLALVCLSATPSGALASSPAKITTTTYAWDEVALTRSFIALLDRQDPDAKHRQLDFMVNAESLPRRVCRAFHAGPAEVLIEDVGDGYTCIDQKDGQQSRDKVCYWTETRLLQRSAR